MVSYAKALVFQKYIYNAFYCNKVNLLRNTRNHYPNPYHGPSITSRIQDSVVANTLHRFMIFPLTTQLLGGQLIL